MSGLRQRWPAVSIKPGDTAADRRIFALLDSTTSAPSSDPESQTYAHKITGYSHILVTAKATTDTCKFKLHTWEPGSEQWVLDTRTPVAGEVSVTTSQPVRFWLAVDGATYVCPEFTDKGTNGKLELWISGVDARS